MKDIARLLAAAALGAGMAVAGSSLAQSSDSVLTRYLETRFTQLSLGIEGIHGTLQGISRQVDGLRSDVYERCGERK